MEAEPATTTVMREDVQQPSAFQEEQGLAGRCEQWEPGGNKLGKGVGLGVGKRAMPGGLVHQFADCPAEEGKRPLDDEEGCFMWGLAVPACIVRKEERTLVSTACATCLMSAHQLLKHTTHVGQTLANGGPNHTRQRPEEV
ncbi:hypothetical protein NDU88_004294 [Pleurodeles waltl]|uniref:Uncharacterized protein n=1 Tax=Pleurodeles waltl TaxID=8319 RepID=A0AAV7M8V7_PLEWA|nr:hypothetical protein NDU88_004294 [Pleurodeles waltl]